MKLLCVCVLSCLCHIQLFNGMDCNPPGSSVHGLFWAKILEWVAISSSRVSSWTRIKPASPALAGRFFTTSATWKQLNCNSNQIKIAESEEELKSLLMKMKENSEKAGLKLNIQKTNFITSWQIDWGNNGNSDRLYFLGLQNHCRWWLQAMKLKDTCSLEEKLWPSILKSRDITFPARVHLVKAMVFPVITYECESWTIRKAERWRIDAF